MKDIAATLDNGARAVVTDALTELDSASVTDRNRRTPRITDHEHMNTSGVAT
ncbi:hypothetical protein ABH926_006723 [Catenulispora sp. GP43]|uniref:hypothetical protein n=1 Tax=Catenulispora sp. GP43 TaxID=3156263 RepID=UPI0035182DC2